jgi:acyl-CoA synthetase (AMP-forming)/AMP-acid ligase II
MSDLIKAIVLSAERNPDLIAISSGDEKMTYRELLTVMTNVAGHAQSNGMQPGKRFLFAAKPSPCSMATALGLIYGGLTLAFVDPLTSDPLFKGRASAVNPDYSLSDPILYLLGKPFVSNLIRRVKKINVANFGAASPVNLSLGKSKLSTNATDISSWLTESAKPGKYNYPEDRPIVIVFTSGTTSDPKGVVHTAGSLGANVEAFANKFDITEGKLVFSEPMTIGVTALARGAQWRIPQKGEVLPDCDVYFGVPTELLSHLREIEKLPAGDRPLVKTVGTGAAPVLAPLIERVYSVLGDDTTVYGVYGMTEMLPIAIVEGREKLAFEGAGDLVGSFVGNTSVTVESDSEVVIHGDGLMRGYLNKEDVQSLPTGDTGIVIDDGRLVLTGRKKDMFIRGNMNIYPGLYEPQLSQIEGVEQAVLVGIEDTYGDDFIVLAVTVASSYSPESVMSRVEREMKFVTDGDAVPDRVVLIDEMPTSGRALKLDRPALKQMVKQRIAPDGAR